MMLAHEKDMKAEAIATLMDPYWSTGKQVPKLVVMRRCLQPGCGYVVYPEATKMWAHYEREHSSVRYNGSTDSAQSDFVVQELKETLV